MAKKKESLTDKEKLEQENSFLKMKLMAEQGATFSENDDSKLSPEIENKWLNYIHNYENIYKNAKKVSVFEFIGKPDFRPAGQLNDSEISKALDLLVETMSSHGVNLDCICEYDDRTIYEFVTEELFKHEVEDLRMEGMTTNFIYEEFYPNHEYDLNRHTEDFFNALLTREWSEYDTNFLCNEVISSNGKEIKASEFAKHIKLFQNNWEKFTDFEQKVNEIQFDVEEGKASVNAWVSYRVVSSNSQKTNYQGNSLIHFELVYDYWCIKKVVVPGFNDYDAKS